MSKEETLKYISDEIDKLVIDAKTNGRLDIDKAYNLVGNFAYTKEFHDYINKKIEEA